MKPVTYKLVTDQRGTIKGLELCQGGNHIMVTFEPFAQTNTGWRWHEVKERVEDIAEQAKEAAAKAAVKSMWGSDDN